MNLTGTTHSLELVTSTSELISYVVSYSDIDKSGATNYTPASAHGQISSATDTTIVAAPGVGTTYRIITTVNIYNLGAANNTLQVQKDVGGTEYPVYKVVLAAGESAHYEDSEGWYSCDAQGTRKGIGATGADGVDGSGTVLGFGTSVVNFGSSGASDATVVVTGQPLITAGSLVYAWIQPTATSTHTADEHLVETLKVSAKDIVAGTGFTLHAFNTNQINEPDLPLTSLFGRFSGTGAHAGPGQRQRNDEQNRRGGKSPFITGEWTIGWMYTQ
jgi:hypothetical protein